MDDKPQKVSFWTALFSIMAAALGVQKRKNMERDLKTTNPLVFVFAGILFLTIFVGSVIFVVSMVAP